MHDGGSCRSRSVRMHVEDLRPPATTINRRQSFIPPYLAFLTRSAWLPLTWPPGT